MFVAAAQSEKHSTKLCEGGVVKACFGLYFGAVCISLVREDSVSDEVRFVSYLYYMYLFFWSFPGIRDSFCDISVGNATFPAYVMFISRCWNLIPVALCLLLLAVFCLALVCKLLHRLFGDFHSSETT